MSFLYISCVCLELTYFSLSVCIYLLLSIILSKKNISIFLFQEKKHSPWLLCVCTHTHGLIMLLSSSTWTQYGKNFLSISDVKWCTSSLSCFPRHIWIYYANTLPSCVYRATVCMCVGVNTSDLLNSCVQALLCDLAVLWMILLVVTISDKVQWGNRTAAELCCLR